MTSEPTTKPRRSSRTASAYVPSSISTLLFLLFGLHLLVACVPQKVDVEHSLVPVTVTLPATSILPETYPGSNPVLTTPTPSTVIGSGNAVQVTQLARLGKGRAHGVAWSSDGQTLAVASMLSITLYDVATLDLKQTVQGSDSAIYVAFSPDGKLLASVPGDDLGPVRLYDAETGKLVRVLEPSPHTAHQVVFSPDGEMIASRIGLSDGVVRLWDVATGQVVRDLPGASMANSLAMSPDGRLLAASGPFHGNVVDVWEVASGQKILTLEHSTSLRGVAFSPDGKMLASTGDDRVAVIWDLETGQLDRTLGGPSSEMLNIVFSPAGRWLAAGTNDGTLIVWDATTGETRLLPGHSSWVSDLAFSPDGQTLASSSFDTAVLLSDLVTGQTRAIEGFTHFIDDIAIGASGRLLVTSSGVPVLWDVASGQASRLSGVVGPQWAADVTPDGTLVATGGNDRGVNLWDGTTGQFLHTLQGHKDSVRKLTFSARGDLLASGSDDGTVIVWDVVSGQPWQTWTGDGKHVFSLAFSPDGKWLAAGIGPDVIVWDVDSGQVQATLKGYVSTAGRGYSSAASDLAFSPDGKLLATAGLDREHSVQLWDVASAQLLDRLLGLTTGVTSVAFSPDGRVLATDGPFYQVVLWDVTTGQTIVTLDGHTDLVVGLAFSPDGTALASGSYDGTVRLWGVKTEHTPELEPPIEQSDGDLTCLSIPEVSIEVCFPQIYSLARNGEANRRGSFVSYDFRPLDEYQTPYLKELQFFSEASIAEFTRDCDESTPCFFGDYPDLDRYYGQREALRTLESYQDFELGTFNDRFFLVANRPCYSDTCVIREYTTFLRDYKLDIWIVMADESEVGQSDQLLSQLVIRDK